MVINGTAGNDFLVGTDGNDTINGLDGNDTIDGRGGDDCIDGGAGNDSLLGGTGADMVAGGTGNDTLTGFYSLLFVEDGANDTLDGGLGDDVYHVRNGDVILADPCGVDTVHAWNTDWTLGTGLENLVLEDTRGLSVVGRGNELDNVLDGSRMEGVNLYGEDGNDLLISANFGGLNQLHGGNGNDTLRGGPHADSFVFDVAPGSANADQITDFESGIDKIHLDARVMPALAASGNFAAGDSRFYAAPGANGGHDGDDRVVYDPTTGKLWYDADGSNPIPAQLIATLEPGTTLVAGDIFVDNGNAGGGGDGHPGDDSLCGGAGNDVFLFTGGRDTLEGGSGIDTVDFSQFGSAVFMDLAYPCTVNAWTMDRPTLSGGTWRELADVRNVENIVGTSYGDYLKGSADANRIEGGMGNDSVWGGAGSDEFVFAEAGPANADRIADFASGSDKIALDHIGFAGAGSLGNFAADDGRFYAGAGATCGHDADDRVIYDTSTGQLYYDLDGSGPGAAQIVATLQGAAALAASDITVI